MWGGGGGDAPRMLAPPHNQQGRPPWVAEYAVVSVTRCTHALVCGTPPLHPWLSSLIWVVRWKLHKLVPGPATRVAAPPRCAGCAQGLSASRSGRGLPCRQQIRQLCKVAAQGQAWVAVKTGCCLSRRTGVYGSTLAGWQWRSSRTPRCSQALKVQAGGDLQLISA